MDELPGGLENILSDPEAMARLTRAAQQLMGNAPKADPDPKASPGPGAALSGDLGSLLKGISAARRPLAEALTPYLGAERGKKLSRALGMAAAVRLAGGALKGAGDHGL